VITFVISNLRLLIAVAISWCLGFVLNYFAIDVQGEMQSRARSSYAEPQPAIAL
jgi:hypothetical protein